MHKVTPVPMGTTTFWNQKMLNYGEIPAKWVHVSEAGYRDLFLFLFFHQFAFIYILQIWRDQLRKKDTWSQGKNKNCQSQFVTAVPMQEKNTLMIIIHLHKYDHVKL